MLTKEQIAQMYQELQGLQIQIKKDPQLGLEYLKDRMILCREMQDKANDLLLRVNRERGPVRTAVRNQKSQIELLDTDDDRVAGLRSGLLSYQEQDEELKYLHEVVTAKVSNLKMTSSDIRLLCGIVEQGIRHGGVLPGNLRGVPVSSETKPDDHPTAPTTTETRELQELVPQSDMQPSELVDSGGDTPVSSIDDFLSSVDQPSTSKN